MYLRSSGRALSWKSPGISVGLLIKILGEMRMTIRIRIPFSRRITFSAECVTPKGFLFPIQVVIKYLSGIRIFATGWMEVFFLLWRFW